MEMFGIVNIVNGKALVSHAFLGNLALLGIWASCMLNGCSYADCPELPEKLNIDGREVSVHLLR
jgi:hypothetical protein